MVEDAEQPGNSVSSVARIYGIHPNQLFGWRRLLYEGALCAVKAGEGFVPGSELKALKARIRQLERLLGKKTMEAEILKKAIEIAREKNCSYEGHHPAVCRVSNMPPNELMHMARRAWEYAREHHTLWQ